MKNIKMNEKETKPFVIILGMHRSGISFIARGLNYVRLNNPHAPKIP